MRFDLYELLKGRYVVWSSKGRQMIGTWNGSFTVQLWSVEDSGESFREVKIGTLNRVPQSPSDASRDLAEHFELEPG